MSVISVRARENPYGCHLCGKATLVNDLTIYDMRELTVEI